MTVRARAPRGLLKSVLYARTDDAAGALYCHEGTINGAYAALEWLGKRVGVDVKRTLTTLSASLAGGDVPLLFMNGVGGLGAPYWLPDFRSEFLPVAGSAAINVDDATELQQIGAVVESIAFLIAVNVARHASCRAPATTDDHRRTRGVRLPV